jgi:Cu+-exporting ATPase
MGRWRLYARNTEVLERMAEVDHVVLDKTGTITYKGAGGEPELQGSLGEEERLALASLARQSAHPLSQAVARWASPGSALPVAQFEEKTGAGIRGWVEGRSYLLGKGSWASELHPGLEGLPEDLACVVIDGEFRATLRLPQRLREGLGGLLGRLGKDFRLSLLSGDNDRAAEELRPLFPEGAELRFRQSPHDKKAYVRSLSEAGGLVLMVGDGLNDAGALLESHVGIAVSEQVDAFSPACDAILDASRLPELDRMLAFARHSMRLLRGGLFLSLAYNVVGLSIAMQGLLSPVVAAILMPLSSVTIVVYGLATTQWAGRQIKD